MRPPEIHEISPSRCAERGTGLLKSSVLKPLLATIEKRRVLRKLGRLAEEYRWALQEVLVDILGR